MGYPYYFSVKIQYPTNAHRLSCLNSQKRKEHYPLPCIDDLLDRLPQACSFFKIDFAQGYHQVAITPGHEPKTAFLSHFRLFIFILLPFRLYNAPSTFQRLTKFIVVINFDWYILNYLDNILIYSNKDDLQEDHLRPALQKL